jgi:hypothetical protein
MNGPVGRVNEFHFTNSYKWVRIALFGYDIEKDARKFWKWIMCNKNAGGGRKKRNRKIENNPELQTLSAPTNCAFVGVDKVCNYI